MDIIALRGTPNKGKSETLNVVYHLMLLFGHTQVPGHFRVLGNPVQKDFTDILEKKGKKIGIVTMGDYDKGIDTVANLLNYLDIQGCDKAICACNSNIPGTVSAVIAYTNHQIIDKTVTTIPGLQRIRNGEDAEIIYKVV